MIRRNRGYVAEFAIRLNEEKGCRATRERLIIVRKIYEQFRQGQEFTAEEICGIVKSAPRRVARSTVYRTLLFLVEIKLLLRVETGAPSQPDPQQTRYRLPAEWCD
ncbi:transcriptional repressor [Gimesia panareensis]|uniref:Ferric uptake regulator family protein n=1 Tax=Gimesia panareensis TaxID=2527978 RepID=A0A518AEC3_9PLAN|nr:transcriptional repressor [Gimesia panareensis]QDT29985.1 Ferric uptake regulator family protein [Gimesia panareensis]QDU53069.1 Ferric uptake regulator family protein [Gimesia panareensis]